MMISADMLSPIWKAYKTNFGSSEFKNTESYKWPVLKQVYEKWNWNLNEDNSTMFDQAFRVKGPKNLWSSRHFYPITMFSEMLKELPAEANVAMNDLLNESVELNERLNTYIGRIESMRLKLQELHPNENKGNHYHGDLRAASLYLTLQYPEKYFLYKKSVYNKLVKQLNLTSLASDSAEKYMQYIQLAVRLKEFIQLDESFLKQYQSFLTDSINYQDPFLHLLVQDFIYFIAYYFDADSISKPSYWIFQGNPKIFDVVGSLKANALKSWTVTAHKDKIKKGDKVILWTTGVAAGCYALCNITSKVENRQEDVVEQQFYTDKSTITEPHNRVSLEIEYNLSEHPVLKETLSKLAEFADFKAGNQGTNYTATEAQYQIILNMVKNEISPETNHKAINSWPSLNQILFGPPGTGKTYCTVSKAIEIVDHECFTLHKDNREQLKKRFDELMIKDWESGNNGQIAFVTFHQSMSYEDFIEGIKPKMLNLDEETTEQGDALSYDIEKGIFTKICDRAKASAPTGLNFDLLWKKFSDQLFQTKTEIIFKSTTSELKLEKDLSSPDSLKLRFKKSWNPLNEQGQAIFHVGKSTIQKLFNQKINLSDPDLRQWVAVRDVVGAGRATTHLAVYSSFYEQAGLAELWNSTVEEKNYVLIIDEINRGNIAQIFGELITLIEEDKRFGKKESLSVMLPYSKSRFSVPKNLYIIGTMNTADRSIEALDTALRRRFTFVEKPPQPEIIITYGKSKGVIEDIDLVKLLETINSRIEKLIDKDHQIGHSYFLDAISFPDLKEVFKNKIIPLLEEYFYGDVGKIGLILGSAFVVEKAKDNFSFAKFEGFDNDIVSDLIERKVYQISPEDSWNINSFKTIYS